LDLNERRSNHTPTVTIPRSLNVSVRQDIEREGTCSPCLRNVRPIHEVYTQWSEQLVERSPKVVFGGADFTKRLQRASDKQGDSY